MTLKLAAPGSRTADLASKFKKALQAAERATCRATLASRAFEKDLRGALTPRFKGRGRHRRLVNAEEILEIATLLSEITSALGSPATPEVNMIAHPLEAKFERVGGR